MCAGAPQSSCCTPPPSQGTGGSRLGVPGLVFGVTWDREGGCLVQRWTQSQLCCPALWPWAGVPPALSLWGRVGWLRVGGSDKVTWVCLPSSHSKAATGEAGGPAMEREGRPERSAGPGQRGPGGRSFLRHRVPWAVQQRPWGECAC